MGKDTLLLLGGTESPETSVLLPSGEEFSFPWHVEDACVITDGPSAFGVITGGVVGERNSVAVWPSESGEVSILPILKTGRRAHACESFVDRDGNLVLLVTGGYGFENRDGLSSTEMLWIDSEGEVATGWIAGKPISCLHELFEC